MPTTYAIPDGRVAFNISLSNTGTTANGGGVAKVISGLAFQPDMVWSKNRSSSSNARWGVIDSVRGVNKTIATNLTDAEITSQTDLLTSFNSNGVNIGADAGGYGWNWNQQSGASDNYAYWLWKAGGTAVSNTAGSITSSVSANTTAGFSVVTWTGTGSGSPSTLGHGLGVAPSMVITKGRGTNSSGGPGAFGANDWLTYHVSLGNAQVIALNSTGASSASSNIWNSTSPTSSVFSIGALNSVNQTGNGYVAYCFAPVAGYSAMGSYVGNGSSDGSFIYTGMRPRFVLIKSSSDAVNWYVYDTSRDTSNLAGNQLYPNLSNAEVSSVGIDILSNGFKVRYNASPLNASGSTYIYACFAENAFKYANAR